MSSEKVPFWPTSHADDDIDGDDDIGDDDDDDDNDIGNRHLTLCARHA